LIPDRNKPLDQYNHQQQRKGGGNIMASSVLEVTGMSCSHCEHSVKTAAGSLAGVKEVKVELKTGQVTVEYDPAQVKLQAIREAIEDQGYDVK